MTNEEIDFDKMSGAEISRLLRKRPDLYEKKCNIEKMKGEEIARLLREKPQLKNKFKIPGVLELWEFLKKIFPNFNQKNMTNEKVTIEKEFLKEIIASLLRLNASVGAMSNILIPIRRIKNPTNEEKYIIKFLENLEESDKEGVRVYKKLKEIVEK